MPKAAKKRQKDAKISKKTSKNSSKHKKKSVWRLGGWLAAGRMFSGMAKTPQNVFSTVVYCWRRYNPPPHRRAAGDLERAVLLPME